MSISSGNTQGMSLDLRSLDRLKAMSNDGKSQKAIKETAKQLEGLFMQELVKSMRSATQSSGLMDNASTEMGTSMLDTQLANQMTGIQGGLGDMIERQLQRQLNLQSGNGTAVDGSQLKSTADLALSRQVTNTLVTPPETTGQTAITTDTNGRKLNQSEQFVLKHQAAARAAEDATGIPANHILGQAALESGWGKHEIKMANGQTSHNLFGIKAGKDWKGKVAEVTTTEYVGGVARKVTAKFRAYDSYADAFTDHAKLLSQSPRYSKTVAQADTAHGFARGLQKAGYATDPAYADKLTKVINTTLRVQRSVT